MSDFIYIFNSLLYSLVFLVVLGIDFKIRTIELDGKKVKLQVWDTGKFAVTFSPPPINVLIYTAGQERFRTITTAYYRGAMGIMLVYDITNEKSFENIKNWIRNIEENASIDVERMILGNKCDISDRRVVSKEKGEKVFFVFILTVYPDVFFLEVYF